MPPLAEAGYYVVAFDQRGYGRTTNWDTRDFPNVDLTTFALTNLCRDVEVLVERLGYQEVECIIGHDFGCVPASLCALTRPDIFKKVVLLGLPFTGIPTPEEKAQAPADYPQPNLHEELANLPQPKKHYRRYYSIPSAAAEMSSPPSNLKDFLRGYFHLKSADAQSEPQPITSMTAAELNKLPPYYIMPQHLTMRDTIALAMTPSERQNMQQNSARWLPDSDLDIYVHEFSRTGFQGGLNWYRVAEDPALQKGLMPFAGKKIEVPCLYMVGTKDWLLHQVPRPIERMKEACTRLTGPVMVEGAGHWVQQEQPEKVVEEALEFLKGE
ncbi:MAG: hypothetical protein Q9183_000851 [Haloplaca sp. 2 TL-2023]